MRGLTDEERLTLTTGDYVEVSADCNERLCRRGLLVPRNCVDCGASHDSCACAWSYWDPTPLGLLALRLDSAARALTVGA